MKVELFSFQQKALNRLRQQCAAAQGEYRTSGIAQVVAFTAPTGAGKTIIMSALIEDILFGTSDFVEQPEAIFVWLSDSPELNAQSRDKIETKADRVRCGQCVTITDEDFDRETLEEGHIYFLNTQKLTRTANLTHHSDTRQYTIWETLSNTIREKADRLYFIIDEAHRGMRGREAGRATTIMQKFILGSTADGLPAVPVVIGMSATIQRFSALVKDSTSTHRPVKVSPEEVRSSGLLKDRIIITYPTDPSEQKDIAVLAAATDEWTAKCRHWEAYCREQHHGMVKPVFVVQVLNGTDGRASDTNLEDCLERIEQRAGVKFERGEVVHCFGDKRGNVTLNSLEVPYEDPSRIQDNSRVRVVFFKEALSTGWDCPRAETMMSFRHYVDATAIAQLLGRMVRTPIQKHILVDDMLNDVRLFLPHFDAEKVKGVVEELQNSEGGELPTDIYEEEFERGRYTITTVRPRPTRKPADRQEGPGLFDTVSSSGTAAPVSPISPVKPINPISHINPEEPAAEKQPAVEQPTLDLEYGLEREKILAFINALDLPTYHIRSFVMSDYLKSLCKLVSFLLTSGLDIDAKGEVYGEIAERIHGYVQRLKASGRYEKEKEQVLNFEMISNVYDAFGEQLKKENIRNMFSATDIDLDRQLRMAEKKLADEGISTTYGRRYEDVDRQNLYKVDVILFVCDTEEMDGLHAYAKRKFEELNDRYRRKTTQLSDTQRTRYRDIVRDSAEVSEVPFTLSDNMALRCDPEGKEYDDHLFVDEATGTVRFKLNGWEQAVVEEERQREDYRCWYRNPSRGGDALAIPYNYKGQTKSFYPDFLFVRREQGGGYVLDIIEPHDPKRDDNVGKAKGLARYAAENPCIGRAQLVRMASTPTGDKLRRLDFAASTALREKVAQVYNNEELDALFGQYGIYGC